MGLFEKQKFINVKGKLLSLEKNGKPCPLVMGILNITPDSFYDGGKWYGNIQKTVDEAGQMIESGASIIDIGGYSSRPGAADITPSEEIERVLPNIEAIKRTFPTTVISIDTFRSKVVEKAVAAGASIVNDISGGNLDSDMYRTVGSLRVPYILMHMRGTPQNMQQQTNYKDLFMEMLGYFNDKVALLRKMGCNDIIIDPGFGFAKNLEQNYWLLSHLDEFKILNLPILAGLSRKSMIYKKLNVTPKDALNGTTILNTVALQKGADILRVHDVKEAVEIITLLYN